MNRFLIIGLITVAAALPAGAQSEAEPYQKASIEMGYSHMDQDNAPGQVLEYDGKVYDNQAGSLSFENKFGKLLLELGLYDIGSGEESGRLGLEYGPVKADASFNSMHHRQDYRRTGMVINGVWTPNPNIIIYSTGTAYQFKRTEKEFNFSLVSPENSARWLSAQYWTVDKNGTREARYANYKVDAAEVNNTKHDLTLGLGANLSDAGAVSVDMINSRFVDNMTEASYKGAATTSNSRISWSKMPSVSTLGGEAKFRYALGKKLSLTGALTSRRRENTTTGYIADSGAGALNAAYRHSDKLSLAAKLYGRWVRIGENAAYANPSNASLSFTGAYGGKQLTQINKLYFRGNLSASYRPLETLSVKGGYKAEFNNRKNAEDMVYAGTRYYYDGTTLVNAISPVAKTDTKQTFHVGAAWELPYDIEAEADYKNLNANNPVFANQANKSDDTSLTVTLPLPYNFSASLIGGHVNDRNTETVFSQFSQKRDIGMVGLDWSHGEKITAGADFAFERTDNRTNIWMGSGATTPPPSVGVATGTYYQRHTLTREENQVIGLHTTVMLPKGFSVTGNGSYTWSNVGTPFGYYNLNNSYYVTDFATVDVRITRVGFAAEYTPENLKELTAKAGYSYQNWEDKTDHRNSGRVNLVTASVSAKF